MFVVNGCMFGRYVMIPTGYAGEMHIYKVISSYKCNTYCDVPLHPLSEPVIHKDTINDLEDLEDVLNVVHCGVDESKIIRVALKDCMIV